MTDLRLSNNMPLLTAAAAEEKERAPAETTPSQGMPTPSKPGTLSVAALKKYQEDNAAFKSTGGIDKQ